MLYWSNQGSVCDMSVGACVHVSASNIIRTATAKDQYRDHLISMKKHREKREDDASQRLWVEGFECAFL